MGLYCALDLHANNTLIGLIDENDRRIIDRRVPNNLEVILRTLAPYRESIIAIAVESTFNWYWLVDGLMEAGYRVQLVNTSAAKQYDGLKFTDDSTDALWLAKLQRLKILPEGYIYPKGERGVRDLLRKRGKLVQQHTANLLSVENTLTRNTGVQFKANTIKKLEIEELERLIKDRNILQAINSSLSVMSCLAEQIREIESIVKSQVKLKPEFQKLVTVDGIGNILALTIMLETGDIGRFSTVGNYSSYCRCVDSKRLSNGKKKGRGNTKNGNPYLAWAYIEAANFAVRYNSRAKSFYQRKSVKTKRVIAIKAVAHKLARACFHIMRDHVDFDEKRAFV